MELKNLQRSAKQSSVRYLTQLSKKSEISRMIKVNFVSLQNIKMGQQGEPKLISLFSLVHSTGDMSIRRFSRPSLKATLRPKFATDAINLGIIAQIALIVNLAIFVKGRATSSINVLSILIIARDLSKRGKQKKSTRLEQRQPKLLSRMNLHPQRVSQNLQDPLLITTQMILA